MGLIRGMARTAVVAGTATHVSNNVSRRQARRYAEQDQQAAAQQVQQAPAQQKDSDDENLAQLEKLGKLHEQGVLTDEEFTAQKKKILAN